MNHEHDCDCGDFESTGGKLSQGWIHWLDKRNEFRTAWLVLAIQGALPKQNGLARTIWELREASKFEKSGSSFIRTKDELWQSAATKEKLASQPLGRLPAAALEKFLSSIQFVDYIKDGQRYTHVGGFYFGDLVLEHSFSFQELFEVFALFGMAPELAVRALHKFGWDLDNARCQPRLYYQCPWSSDC